LPLLLPNGLQNGLLRFNGLQMLLQTILHAVHQLLFLLLQQNGLHAIPWQRLFLLRHLPLLRWWLLRTCWHPLPQR
jgi:hypothetical protein